MKRTVLVTGGCTGIGAAISTALAEAGWRVLRSSSRPEAHAEITADLGGENGIETLVRRMLELAGGVPDAIVCNAAVFCGDEAKMESINTASMLALYRAMKEAGPVAEGAPARTMVTILDSKVLEYGFAPSSKYEQTKQTAATLTIELNRECMPDARIVGVAPGPVSPPACGGVKAAPTPLGRPTAQDVARAVLFLLDSPRIAGCIISVDGGANASMPRPGF